FSAVAVFAGSWLSGFFIIATDAWMQNPVGYRVGAGGQFELASLRGLLFNPWIFWQYLHNMTGSVVTASFVMAAVGAFYLLTDAKNTYGRTFVRVGVMAGFVSIVLMVYPTGDGQGKMIANHQQATLAAMEGLFDTTNGAPIAVVGQPDTDKRKLDNPLLIPRALSFLTYRRWGAQIRGLNAFPQELWPDNIALLYFSYHIMVGLGTVAVAVMTVALFLLVRGKLFEARWLLWILMLLFPLPYIATTAGWMTAEIGRQPWLVYGVMRTAEGPSPMVSAGNGMFTLLGFMGMYLLLGILFLFLIYRQIERGPGE
ncbi:MAG: cytochrome ubiquinol oxidase subunit I, partial [Acidobacteriota bacterium]|nr:cytochrome ubiquinol oxidase subunit I [Acidobacteriota bacterium]